MSNLVMVNYSGSGTAFVDNPTPLDGDPVTLYAYADPGETLDDIIAIDSHGQYIAVAVQPQQTFNYDETYWGDHITITVTFSGSPPTPTTPVWLSAIISKTFYDRYRGLKR